MEVSRPQPYIGISGVASFEQHLDLFALAHRAQLGELGHFMMIGVQASGKTQVREVENRYGGRWYPVGDAIRDAAANDDSGLTRPYVHCSFEDDEELRRGLEIVMRRTRHYSKGLQLNRLPWLSRDYRPWLHQLQEEYPNQSLAIQANRGILDSYSPAEVAKALGGMPVHYVLLDASGGSGTALDTEQLRSYVDEIYQQQLPIGVVVAGGLEAQNVESLFGPLVEVYPGLSCDAEGRLHSGAEGSQELDLAAAEQFVLAWKEVVSRK